MIEYFVFVSSEVFTVPFPGVMNSKKRSKDKPTNAKKMKMLDSSDSDSSNEGSDLGEVQVS